MTLSVGLATAEDAAAIVRVRNAAADDLTARFGKGHWSSMTTDRGVLLGMKHSRVLVARDGAGIVGTLRLATKKPWAIDRAFFTPVKRPIYLIDMAVDPALQRHGIGRMLLNAAEAVAVAWPGDSICLDAYDVEAGAGAFYARCGYREVGRVVYRRVPLVYFERALSGHRR